MLPRGKRLTRATFGTVSAGKRTATRHFSISITKSPEGRASVVVSKKVAKKSTDRHLVKRRTHEIITPWVTPGHSFVVYARTGCAELTYTELKDELTELLTSLPKV